MLDILKGGCDYLLTVLLNFVNWAVPQITSHIPTTALDGSLDGSTAKGFFDFIGWVNYFVPVPEIIAMTAVWIGCVGAYYLWQWAMRLIRSVH